MRRVCRPGCPHVAQACPIHGPAARRADRHARTAQERGYTYRWAQVSTAHLAVYRLCGDRADGTLDGFRGVCHARGLLTPAEVTDHIQPHKGDPALFWDPRNWQSLCRRCNTIKALQFEGFRRGARADEAIASLTPPARELEAWLSTADTTRALVADALDQFSKIGK